MIRRPVQYTDLDFDRLRARLLELARSVFPDWDPEVAAFGTMMLELFSYVGDVLLFRQDQLARESRWSTATQRRSIIALASLVGESLLGAAAATAEVELSLARPPASDVLVPAGTVLRTDEAPRPVRFQLLAPALFRAGLDPALVLAVAEHSQTHTLTIATSGAPNLIVRLDAAPYLEGSLTAATPQGPFSTVGSFLATGPTDRHVVVDVDDQGQATLRFGDGRVGVAPAGSLSLSYKSGGGEVGNVERGALRVVESTVLDASGRPASVRVTNPARATGGIDRETVAQARRRIPEAVRAPSRTVAREDFEIHARQVPGVARALMLTRNEDPTIGENAGVLYVVPRGGGMPTPALRGQVFRQVTVVYPCTLTFQVQVQNPVYRTIDVQVRIYLTAGAAPAVVGRSLRDRLAEHFAVSLKDGTPNPQVDFGHYLRTDPAASSGDLAWSKIADVVIDTQGVHKLADARLGLTLNGLPADVLLAVRELPVLGRVSIVRADTGELL